MTVNELKELDEHVALVTPLISERVRIRTQSSYFLDHQALAVKSSVLVGRI